uniref:Uncharacterized protein n=1 Tax=Rhizophagus irregularis (strain DAOM 181602 / DAOM 197198 / MUCL 43194) TaxID=747089 RepID=U9SFP9_RHIID
MPSLSCFIVGTSYEATISKKKILLMFLERKLREYRKKAGSQDSLEAIYHLIWALRRYYRVAIQILPKLDRYVFVDDSNLFIEDTTLGHAIESVVSMYPRYSDISSRRWRLLPAYNAVLALQLESRSIVLNKA